MKKIEHLLKKYKIDAYFCGHSHALEHIYDPFQTQFHSFVSGSASHISKAENILNFHTQKYYKVNGFLNVKIAGDIMRVEFIDATNGGKILNTVPIFKQQNCANLRKETADKQKSLIRSGVLHPTFHSLSFPWNTIWQNWIFYNRALASKRLEMYGGGETLIVWKDPIKAAIAAALAKHVEVDEITTVVVTKINIVPTDSTAVDDVVYDVVVMSTEEVEQLSSPTLGEDKLTTEITCEANGTESDVIRDGEYVESASAAKTVDSDKHTTVLPDTAILTVNVSNDTTDTTSTDTTTTETTPVDTATNTTDTTDTATTTNATSVDTTTVIATETETAGLTETVPDTSCTVIEVATETIVDDANNKGVQTDPDKTIVSSAAEVPVVVVKPAPDPTTYFAFKVDDGFATTPADYYTLTPSLLTSYLNSMRLSVDDDGYLCVSFVDSDQKVITYTAEPAFDCENSLVTAIPPPYKAGMFWIPGGAVLAGPRMEYQNVQIDTNTNPDNINSATDPAATTFDVPTTATATDATTDAATDAVTVTTATTIAVDSTNLGEAHADVVNMVVMDVVVGDSEVNYDTTNSALVHTQQMEHHADSVKVVLDLVAVVSDQVVATDDVSVLGKRSNKEHINSDQNGIISELAAPVSVEEVIKKSSSRYKNQRRKLRNKRKLSETGDISSTEGSNGAIV